MNLLENEQKIIEGTGNILFSHQESTSSFVIKYKPLSIKITVPSIRMGQLFSIGLGTIDGTLSDGRKLKCDSIALVAFDKTTTSFAPLKDLIIGDLVKGACFNANLIGAYLGEANFTFEGNTIEIKENKQANEILEFCNSYGNILEGSELMISNPNSNTKELIKLSKEITLLLSLIKGNSVTYNRYKILSSDRKKSYEVWRNLSVEAKRGNGSINLNDLNDTLMVLLKKFNLLSPEEKKCYETVIDYLNSTSLKYLEECILNIAQAWEILAEMFNKDNIDLNEEIKLLKADLKLAIKNWKQKNSISYDTGFISDRVIKSLYWETAIKKMEGLAVKENLNTKKIGLDFKKLVEVRNSIVHTGRFRDQGKEFENLELLHSSILGIQVLIFSKLGYSGNLVIQKGGLITLENINDFKNVNS
jgi:hypothetical protein